MVYMENLRFQKRRELTPVQKVGRWIMVAGTAALLTSPFHLMMTPKLEELRTVSTATKLGETIGQIYKVRDRFVGQAVGGGAIMCVGILLRHGRKRKKKDDNAGVAAPNV